MTEVIRYGDLYGYDDAEVIQDDDASSVIDTSNSEGSEENADVE